LLARATSASGFIIYSLSGGYFESSATTTPWRLTINVICTSISFFISNSCTLNRQQSQLLFILDYLLPLDDRSSRYLSGVVDILLLYPENPQLLGFSIGPVRQHPCPLPARHPPAGIPIDL